jgi:hypothetical protein
VMLSEKLDGYRDYMARTPRYLPRFERLFESGKRSRAGTGPGGARA